MINLFPYLEFPLNSTKFWDLEFDIDFYFKNNLKVI